MWRDGERPASCGTPTSVRNTAVGAGPPPSRPSQTTVLTTQDDQLTQSKLIGEPLAELDQGLGPCWVCHERSGRLTRRTPAWARGQGWVKHPGHSRRLFLCSSFACVPVRGRSTMSRAGRAAILVFCHIALPLLRRRGTRFISGSNKALATVPFPGGDDRPFVEAANSCSTRMVRLGDGWRPSQATSGPPLLKGRWLNSTGARHSSEKTQFSITPAYPSSSTTRRKAYCQRPNAAPFAPGNARAITCVRRH
jgi:hypothetical protein